MKNKFVFFLTTYLMLSSGAIAHINVFNPWVNASSGPNAALYMQIQNTSNKPDKLTDVKSTQYSRIEFHNHVDTGNGVLHMEKVDFIDIPPRGFRQLTSGGYHIMLRNLQGSLQVGQVVHFTLTFENGGTIQINAPVKAMGAVD